MNHPEPARVLLVDDDIDLLETLQEQLRCEGFDVKACPSPEAALAEIRTADFAAIVSDQHMPGMTGLEFFARARELQPTASREGVQQDDTFAAVQRALGEQLGTALRRLLQRCSSAR